MEFVAIDFETINQYCNSACSIGLAKMNEKGPPHVAEDPIISSQRHIEPRSQNWEGQ